MKEMNVNTACIERVDEVSTGVANIVVAEGDNSIIVVPGSNYEMTKEIIDKNKEVIQDADIVLVQLEIPIEVVEYTVELCNKYKVKVMLNPAPVF